MFEGRDFKKFIKRFSSVFNQSDEIVLVKCKNISPKAEKYIKSALGNKGVIVKDLWYTEQGVGELGILFALKSYSKKVDKPFYAVAIRGKFGKPRLFYVNKSNIKVIS